MNDIKQAWGVLTLRSRLLVASNFLIILLQFALIITIANNGKIGAWIKGALTGQAVILASVGILNGTGILFTIIESRTNKQRLINHTSESIINLRNENEREWNQIREEQRNINKRNEIALNKFLAESKGTRSLIREDRKKVDELSKEMAELSGIVKTLIELTTNGR